MFTFTFSKDPLKLGSYDEKYGQRWWGEVNEDLKPVSFNTMNKDANFRAGDVVSCEESLNKRTQKGKDYLQLKKVRVEEKNPSEPSYVADTDNVGYADVLEVLYRIEKKLDTLLGNDEELVTEIQPEAQPKWEQAREKLAVKPLEQVTTDFGDEDVPDF